MAQGTDYTNYITSEHADKPLFVQVIALLTSFATQIQSTFNLSYDIDSDIEMLVDTSGGFGSIGNLPLAFDIDVAVGVMLDAIGLRVGLPRSQNVPTYGVINLDDDNYRTMLRSKIQANHWDGSMEGLQTILNGLFTGASFTLLAYDNQDMTMSIYVVGGTPTALQLALINGGLISPRPEGVEIVTVGTITDPLFGLDFETQYIAGLDVGAFS